MCGVVRVFRHLPKRVLRQYRYVQTIPRHPTDVVELRPPQIVEAFLDFNTCTLKKPDWGDEMLFLYFRQLVRGTKSCDVVWRETKNCSFCFVLSRTLYVYTTIFSHLCPEWI